MDYNTSGRKRTIIILIILAILAAAAGVLGGIADGRAAEGQLAKCWILCRPGTQVNVRRRPTRDSRAEGYLEAGDEILTDGESREGWIRVYGVGENGGGWVWCGYVATEKPEPVMEQYVCVATKRAAARRWIGGPQVQSHPWLKNGENVDVFYIADGWACTNRGYVQCEWLEVDPK